jgi:protein-S-isoprenylcysteine O-methyltransferase Ste14
MRVPCGFLLVIAFAWLSRPTALSLAIGLPLGALGLAIRAWAAGHLEKNTRLATAGPYARVRNPLYIGTLITAAGLVAASRRWPLAILFGTVFLFVYLPVIELEEQHLRKLFPEYADYAGHVPALIPGRRQGGDGGEFRWARYLRNEEYQAGLGFLAGTAWLLVRLWWR